ncbi:MAG: hypothetical protein R2873_34990 [Caldilineaceae bacterium]
MRTSLLLIPIAHTLIAAPFVVRTLLPILRSLDPRLREAASVMEPSPLRWWEVELAHAVAGGAGGSGLRLHHQPGRIRRNPAHQPPDLPTMPVVIYRALSQPGLLNYGRGPQRARF